MAYIREYLYLYKVFLNVKLLPLEDASENCAILSTFPLLKTSDAPLILGCVKALFMLNKEIITTSKRHIFMIQCCQLLAR